MMFKTISFAAMAAVFTAGSAFAQDKPWEMPRPENMTERHQDLAKDVAEVYKKLRPDEFGYSPDEAEWNWSNGRNLVIPLSNMSKAALTQALNGRYHVYQTPTSERWSVRYYSAEGKTHFCESTDFDWNQEEWSADRYIDTTAFGLAGLFHWDKVKSVTPVPTAADSVGWPTVMAENNLLYSYNYDAKSGTWIPFGGWLQDDYAAAFAEHCPNLPRVTKVNNDQLGDSANDLLKNAKIYKGAKTSFVNDPVNPLTAQMFFWGRGK
jgi:hypothetical protein